MTDSTKVKFNKYAKTHIKVTKLKDNVFNNDHPNSINEGYTAVGVVNVEESNKAQALLVIKSDETGRFFHTSQVLEIEECTGYDLLRTINSIYKVELNMASIPGMQEKYNLKID